MIRWVGVLMVVFIGAGIAERAFSEKDNGLKRAFRRFRRHWWD